MRSAALFALLPILANAAAVERRTADSNVGSTTSDVFPPAGSQLHLLAVCWGSQDKV